jgi:predicted RNA binding protein YcfA (HicA-like mRNA interferase family)
MTKLIEGESKVVARALEHGGAVAIREKSSHRYFAEP